MSKPLVLRRHARLTGLLWFIPGELTFLAVAFVPAPWSLLLLLLADVFVMLAVVRAAGFLKSGESPRYLWRRGLAYAIGLSAYTAYVAIVVGLPLRWLWNVASLGAVLAVSAAVVLALLWIWRIWPAFGLIFVWRRACLSPAAQPPRSTLARSLARAWQVTAANEIFFSHGLIVAICVFALAQVDLSLAGVDAPIPPPLFLVALALYALVFAPFAHWVIAGRSAAALLLEHRRERTDRVVEPAMAEVPVDEPDSTQSPAGLDSADLDAMLLRCVRAGQTQLALAALAHGANPDTIPPEGDRDQRSVLALAAVNPDLRLLRGLIAKGADLNRAHAGLTPLLAATRDSREGRPDAVMTLLTNGADPRCTDAQGNAPLHFAVLSARPIVAALLCDGEARVNAVNRDGLTPLGVACGAANWELVRFLLERGASVEVEHAQPALVAAAALADDDIQGIQWLLKRKLRVDAPAALGRTALMTAALNGHAAIVQALLEAGAQIDLADTRGVTALMEAARAGAHAVIAVLAKFKPAPDRVDANGRTALMIASQSTQASEDTVRALLALGATRDKTTSAGRRAVDFAAGGGRWAIVAILDPQYPLPATLVVPEPADAQNNDSPAHLLDALRFTHWAIVDEFAERARAWPQADLAGLFDALMTHSESAPRHWLLRHGLDAEAHLADERRLFDAAVAQLPNSLPASIELVAAGAQVGGSDAFGRICHVLDPTHAPHTALENFALELLDRGAEAFAPDAQGCTPLAHAVAAGSLRLTQALLARGADPQGRDQHGRTPLFAALRLPLASAQPLIQGLLRAGADPATRAVNGETPLGLALARSEPALRRWLKWPGWKLPPRGLRQSDLVAAAASGDVDAVEKLLELGFPIHATDAQGGTALIRAAANGHVAMVEFLLKHGAVSAQAATTGATALTAASSAQREQIVEILLDQGADVDQRLRGGSTALMIAAALGHTDSVIQLLRRGAAVNAQDEHGVRALHVAAQFVFLNRDGARAQRLLETLLDAGAEINARTAEGQTALLLLLGARAEPGAVADQKYLLGLLPLLRKHPVDLNLQDQRGVSALHACAMHGLLLPARALLAAGADPECRDLLDRTPREVAHLLGFIDVAKELGASIIAVPERAEQRLR